MEWTWVSTHLASMKSLVLGLVFVYCRSEAAVKLTVGDYSLEQYGHGHTHGVVLGEERKGGRCMEGGSRGWKGERDKVRNGDRGVAKKGLQRFKF